MNLPDPKFIADVAAGVSQVKDGVKHAAESTQLIPSGKVPDDLGQAAYLVFSGLAVTATFVALHYGKKALKSLGRVMNTEGTRILHGVVEKMSQRFQQKFGLNEFSPEGRERATTAMVGDWIRLGKDDATSAAGLLALGLLEEPVRHADVLGNHFSPESIARERNQKKRPVFSRTLEYAETATALCQGASVTPSDRDKMLAALVLHLPEPGGTVLQEHVALIESIGGMGARLMQGLRLLAPKAGNLDSLKEAPGPKLLLATDRPLGVLYRVDQQTFLHRRQTKETPAAPTGVTVNANGPGSVIILQAGAKPPAIEVDAEAVEESQRAAKLLTEAVDEAHQPPPLEK